MEPHTQGGAFAYPGLNDSALSGLNPTSAVRSFLHAFCPCFEVRLAVSCCYCESDFFKMPRTECSDDLPR